MLEALAGATEDELDAPPAAPDDWTARMVVHHLADSEMISAMRLRRLIADDHPVIEGYDEPRFARRLFYDDRAIEPSLAALGAPRGADLAPDPRPPERRPVGASRASTPNRAATASRTGCGSTAAHAHEHADQIRRAMSTARAAGGPASC